jgi:hypothetical protein
MNQDTADQPPRAPRRRPGEGFAVWIRTTRSNIIVRPMPSAIWRLSSWFAALVVVVQLSQSLPAAAQSLQLGQYVAPSRCPARASAEAQLRSAVSSAQSVAIGLRATTDGYEGQIELLPPGSSAAALVPREPVWRRVIRGQDCGQLLAALALSLAIHLDEVRGEERPAAAPPAPTLAAAPAPPTVTTDSVSWSWGGLAGAEARSGLSPSTDLGLIFGVGVERKPASGVARSASLSVHLGLGGSSPVSSTDASSWAHDWWTIAGQVCPWSFSPSRFVRFEPCAGLQLGRYSAEIAGEGSADDWLALADVLAAARVRWGIWQSRLELGGTLPLSPLGMERQGQVFFRQNAGWMAALALGVEAF